MPVGTESTRVSLNLVSVPKPAAHQAVKETPAPAVQTETKPEPIQKETKIKKLVKRKQPENKSLPVQKNIKPAPQKTAPKKAENKVVKNKEQKLPERTTSKPQPVKAEPMPQAEAKPEVKSQEAAGVNNSPKLVSNPTFATRPSPVKYPRIAKRRGIEGQVMIEVWIAPDGKQIKQTLLKSSGTTVLDEAALKAIKRWRFSSHVVDGQAIAHRVQIPVRFKLD
ncbi:Ferric siderophore transport system, periplasmic binding protein TonB [Photobacterium marinum]|uniref:Ferric siderophore transport system, periplasmic binding protein TonB n=2 Tax=Photobacterium marinum TaxID=1056511 RepID=L8JJS8_9GAMM|nr:Ferric siderophore transport system, periplasmic binding protein TonB [Photobacterium marinum]